ncbi:hypothetical protein N9C70_03870 [Flavobacteriales bacterium]|nr:hypothetical protein [Flavobacteriales bacterium]
MTNGSLSGGAFTPNAGATSTVITFTFSVSKNKYRTLDNVTLTGTFTCTPTDWYIDADGDGLGDDGTSQSSCDQPAGYVADSSDNCDDLSACNYDDVANGVCTYPGCTNASACNYDLAAGCDDGSCTLASGCDACSGESDGSGTVVDGDSDDDGICNGSDNCSDTSACNYDGALYANDACDVPTGCQNCSGGAPSGANTEVFTVDITFDAYATETSWSLVNGSSEEVWSEGVFTASESNNSFSYSSTCLPTTGTYTFTMEDTFGDGMCYQGACGSYNLVVGDVSFVGVTAFTNATSIEVEFGCTDSGADNYNSTADVDNGTCVFSGCTDASACNYDASASTDDGSCTYATTWYEDSDSDNAGDPNSTTTSCTQPVGYVAVAGDECPSDGSLQTAPTWYEDSDGDNAGDPSSTTTSCTQPAGYVAVAGDGCPTDPNKTGAGACGCGTADTDTDSDGTPDCNDTDDDNDGVLDGVDTAPLDPDVCADADGDGCDDCSIGTDGFGPLADNTPNNDGTDFDGDGLCDSGDPDDDNDGALDADDSDDNDANVCSDTDGDGCDDCANGSYDPASDGTDTDGDGLCNSGDPDDDGDGVLDGADSAPLNPNVCSDTDGDGCDDCANGSYDPDNDGTDTDGDGTCDSGDGCPNDPLKTSAGICGCGNVDVDNNSNGICDTEECIDSANPVAATNDITLYLDASGAASVTGLEINDGSTDDCAIVNYALDKASFDCTDIGSAVTVTLTVTDGVGNTDTETAVVTVLDNTAPTPTASNATQGLDASGNYTLTAAAISAAATDNCTASPSLELSKDDATWSTTLAYTCSDLGANTVYVRATDGYSNVSTGISVTLTIEDNTKPTISSVSSGLTEILSGAGAATIDAASYITASDNCTASGSLTYQVSESTGTGFATTFTADCGDLGSKTLYFRVVDGEGNISDESTEAVVIADQTAPTISSVSGTTIGLDGAGAATITASDSYVTATDNCTASGSLTYLVSTASDGTFASTVSVDCADIGALNLFFQAQDEEGNTSAVSGAASFTIADNVAPTLTASDATVSLDNDGNYTLLPATLSPSATDNCASSFTYTLSTDNATWVSSLGFACADIGSNAVYIRAYDGGTYSNGVAVALTVEDSTGPTVSASDASLSLDGTGSVTMTASDVSATATDNCTGAPTIELSHNQSVWASSLSFDCDSLGGRTVYLRASDGTNTGAISSVTVTVTDPEAPVAVANNLTLNLTGSTVTLDATNSTFNTSTDNCSVASSTITVNGTTASAYDFSLLGLYTVTLTVVDAQGNTASNTAQVTVTSAPTVLYEEDFEDASLLADGDMCGSGTVTAANGNYFATCAASDFIGVVSYAGSQQFTWEDSDNAGWQSPVISIAGYIVDFSAEIAEETNIDVSDNLTLFISLDGGAFQQYDQRNRCSCSHAPFSATGLMGSTMQIMVFASNDQNENWYMDNVLVQGCVDQDSDGICDPADPCIDFPAGSCGCTDATACNYTVGATKDDGSCNLPGLQCAAPSGNTAYVFTPNAAGNGCDCVTESMTQLYVEPFDDEVYQDETGQYLSICSEYTANDDNWTASCPGAGGMFIFPAAQSGADLDLNVYQSSGNLWTTASIDVSAYGSAQFTSLVSDNATLGTSDGWTVSAIQDDVNTGTIASIFDDVAANTPLSGNVSVLTTSALKIQVKGDAANAGMDIYMDDVTVYGFGKTGCTDADAINYDATAFADDGSCLLTIAYSYYDGGFTDKIWRGDACTGGSFGCGEAPYVKAVSVDAAGQTSSPSFNYHISSGTTVTVDGTQLNAETGAYELFLKDLYIEDGGLVHVPAGNVLVIKGSFTAMDSNPFSGPGLVCFAGPVSIPEGEGTPATVTVGNIDFPPTANLVVPAGKTLVVNGDVSFGTEPPAIVGMLKLQSDEPQTVSGQGARFDVLEIDNSSTGDGSGVTFSGGLEVKGRLTLTAGDIDVGSDTLKFGSDANGSGLLDPIPSGSSIKGTFAGGRIANQMNTDPRVEVERFIGPDGDGSTNWGYTMFGTSISGATVSDFNDVADFYSAGWSGSAYPNATSTVSFWNEATGSIEYASSDTQSLTDKGCWVLLYGTQSPTMKTEGVLNDHQVDGSSKVFSITRQGPNALSAGWNMVYNPYQAKLDWNAVYDSNNSAVIEDQFLIFDTQERRFRRYGVNTAGIHWSTAQEAAEDSVAMRYVNPGQGFWVRVKSGVSSGSFTLDPSMIDNDGTAVDFIRSANAGNYEVVLEVENDNGATRMLLRFGADGSAVEYRDGDMSYLSSSTQLGELAVVVDGQKYVAKGLPLEAFEAELYVKSRANMASTIRVIEVLGVPNVCVHIEDQESGEVLVLEEGAELTFTLPAQQAEEGRFTLHSVPFGVVEGQSPDCPDSEAGAIVMELGEAVVDVVVTNYETMEVAATLFQETGTLEIPMAPGEYAIMMDAQEGTSFCRGGRRHALIAPGEQPELLGLEPIPSDCNEGLASLSFELYGSGDYQTELMQGNTSVWSQTLSAGEHILEDIAPEDYVLKVSHVCLETFEFVSLLDPLAPDVSIDYDAFVETETAGGAWLQAICVGCVTGEGYGYTWLLEGEAVASDGPLSIRVDEAGTYGLELVTYGLDCPVRSPFDITVGKFLVEEALGFQWLGVQQGMLGVAFESEWKGTEVRGYDAAGRLVLSEVLGDVLGENFIALPEVPGWFTLELSTSDGKVARWTGVR